MFRAIMTAGQQALKSCLLINGGAAVALMAFAGHLVEQTSPSIPIRRIANSMAMFVAGVLAGVGVQDRTVRIEVDRHL